MRNFRTTCRLAALIFMCLSARANAAANEEEIRKSVVKIFTFAQSPNYYQPWQMNNQISFTGSGAVIDGQRILTNAHVVSDQVYLQVRKAGESKKYTARVEFVAHDCELAILKVEEAGFFTDSKPLKFGELPRQRDKVAAYGFPTGGDDLSVTEGVVSRIEVTPYTHSGRALLTIQTDAAINPGNSGGPVLKDGKIIGVSFQSYSAATAQNTGYIVPVVLISRFLKDIADGKYDGIPELGVIWQKMENENIRNFYKMPSNTSGILVNKVSYGSSAWEYIREGDIITSVGGVKIANDGTVTLRKDERILNNHLISLYQTGEKAEIGILRDGSAKIISPPMKDAQRLVEGPFYDVRPSYFVFGGLVFTKLTKNYINLWPWDNVATPFKFKLEFAFPSKERKETVILSHVLPHDINAGYHDMRGLIIDTVNGQKIGELKDVISALSKPAGKYHVILTDSDTDFGGSLILDAQAAAKANPAILSKFKIAADRSEDLK